MRVTVGTQNLGNERNIDALLDTVLSTCDVAGLQEAGDRDAPVKWALDRHTRFVEHDIGAGAGRGKVPILTRLPIEARGFEKMGPRLYAPSPTAGKWVDEKWLTWVRSGGVTYANTHLAASVFITKRRKHHAEHIRRIARWAETVDGPVVVVGDFNCRWGHRNMRPLKAAGFRLLNGKGATHRTTGRRIDFILGRGDIDVAGFDLVKTGSDHKLVRAALDITVPAPPPEPVPAPVEEPAVSSVVKVLRDAGFEVHTRREWGSPRERDGSYDRRRRTHPMPAGPAPYHYLHITVTRDTDSIAEGAAGARQVEGYGYSTPPMVSYQMLVTNEGRIYEGQNYGVKGTHTVNDKLVSGFPRDLNLYGYAVALMQNVDDAVTDAQVAAVAACFAAAELTGYVKRGAPIHPHRKFAWKSCPGDKAVARLEQIEALKNQLVATGLPRGANTIGHPQEDDMPYTDWPQKDREALVDDLLDAKVRSKDGRDVTVRDVLRSQDALRYRTDERLKELLARDGEALAAEIAAHLTELPAARVKKAVKDALREGVE